MSRFDLALMSGSGVRKLVFTHEAMPKAKVVVKLDKDGKVISCKVVEKK